MKSPTKNYSSPKGGNRDHSSNGSSGITPTSASIINRLANSSEFVLLRDKYKIKSPSTGQKSDTKYYTPRNVE